MSFALILLIPIGGFAKFAGYGDYVESGNEVPCGGANPCCTVYNACNAPCNNYDYDFVATGGCDMSCTGTCLTDTDGDGICDENEIDGCTDVVACNYDSTATEDDGSCEYFSCATFGCIDSAACNYNAEAQFEDGTCTYPTAGLDCDGQCINDADDDGVCDDNEVIGCDDPEACDFNADATESGACDSYPDAGYDCLGNCLLDSNANGICDVEETTGCTDASACNYNTAATLDDATCEYLSCAVFGCMDSDACNYDATATQDAGDCAYPELGYDCTGVCLLDGDADGVCDAFEVMGCTDAEAINYDEAATESDESCIFATPPPAGFEFTPTAGSGLLIGQVTLDGTATSGEDWIAALDSEGHCAGSAQIVINDGIGYAQLVIYADDITSPDLDEGISDSEPFTLQLYVAASGDYIDYFSPSGQTEFNGWANTNGAPIPVYSDPDVVYDFSIDAYVPNCLDATACNYDASSTSSSGCYYADEGYTCDGICLQDSDEDGVCDALEVVGCQVSSACNYDAMATDSSECEYAATGYTCDGACLLDSDDDGTCDPFEIMGCTDAGACNYDGEATEDDANCTYPESGYNCAGGCAADVDLDGVCDAFEVLGCDNNAACNYEILATEDDGSCTFPPMGYGCDGDCLADTDGDGVCDALEVAGCTDSGACNYEANATESDGSCADDDAVGVCGGDCLTDADADGLCDDLDPCIGSYDTCGICNGPGAVYACGCVALPEGDCDCNGHQEDALGTCGGDCLVDLDSDGICDDIDVCVGALDACGVCNGPGASYACGCAEIAVGDCDCEGNELDAVGVCGGLCELDTDGDGVCDDLEVLGCTEIGACNFNADATEENGSCSYPETGLDCGGNCLEDVDEDGVCDENEIAGCDDDQALNFNPSATDDDGTCFYPVPPPPSFDVTGTPSSGTMFGQATLDGVSADPYDWIGAFDGDGNCAGASQMVMVDGIAYINLTIYGDDATTSTVDEGITGNEPFYLLLWDESAQTTIYFMDGSEQTAMEGWTNTNGAPIPGLDDPMLVYDFSTLEYEPNCNDPQACNFDSTATVDVGCVYADWAYDCDGNCLADSDGDGVCNPLEINGCVGGSACNFNPLATDDNGTCVYPSLGYGCDGNCLADADGDGICDALEQQGCMDATACNYDADATDEDGSCFEAEDGYDCEGTCLSDSDADSVCDGDEVDGCDDESACNFQVLATENDGSCAFPNPFENCEGLCVNDADADGICDELEGCTDDGACNFSADYVDDDGSCVYPAAGLDCEGNCLADGDGDEVCDANEIAGCTYSGACNFEPLATDDDGTCLFVPMGLDCQFNCLFDADLDGICDANEIPGCTTMGALNYLSLATDDDGSCQFESCSSDLDGDGVVNIGDILNLLTEYGAVCD